MPDPLPSLSNGSSESRSIVIWAGAFLVGLLAFAFFGYGLAAEPAFADESAYYSQSYYAKLFAQHKRDDPAWLEYMGYDLPPLPKYLIGAMLWQNGYPLPNAGQARDWYKNTSLRVDPPGALTAARWPFVALGALGCVAIYGIAVIATGVRAGILAASLLAINPLYRLHARRAMSDVPCEAFMLLAFFVALWCWTRWLRGQSWPIAAVGPIVAGAFVGLALLCKLSGTLALFVIAAWSVLGLVANSSLWRRLGNGLSTVVVPLSAAAVFIALNPFLTARPEQVLPKPFTEIARMSISARAEMMIRLRPKVAAGQQELFPHNALYLPAEKLSVMAIQGFGRFGPFGPAHSDSTKRFDGSQDSGGIFWLPLIAAGWIWALVRGWRQRAEGAPPTSWALEAYWLVTLCVLTAYLPMAWDRYMLSIQAPSVLLVAGVVSAALDAIWRLGRPRREEV